MNFLQWLSSACQALTETVADRWFERRFHNARQHESRQLDLAQMEDRMMFSASPAVALMPAPDPEVQVQATDDGTETAVMVADAEGNSVTAWSEQSPEGDWDVIAQRFDALGNALSEEFGVNSYTEGDQHHCAVAMNSSGDMILVWQSEGQDGDGGGIFAQRYDESGRALGAEFRVNTTTAGDQSHPAVAIHDDGTFSIAWVGRSSEGESVFLQKYDATGSPEGGEIQVSEATSESQKILAIEATPDGDFLVNWSVESEDGLEVYSSLQQAMRHEIVFVDTATPDYQQLVDGLLADNSTPDGEAGGRVIDVVLLDATRDGVSQISEVLSGYQDLDAVHIISHGTDGAVRLGSLSLSSENVDDYTAQISGWRDSLATDADLLFYGCNLASSEEGDALLDTITNLTGADVAASVDPTGHATLGGDWDLEYQLGDVQTTTIVAATLQEKWVGLLAPAGVTVTPISSTTTEAGGQAQFEVVLDALPDSDVTITITSSDTTEGTVSTSLLTFTTENWATPQTVTITGVDDDHADGDIVYTIVTGAVSSLDANYNGLSVDDILITNTDDEEPVDVNLWVHTYDSVVSSGVPGLDSWTQGQELEFSGSDLHFESGGTSGSFSLAFDINPFVAEEGHTHISGIHHVKNEVTLGSGFTLLPDDILFSISTTLTIGGCTMANQDICVMRPDTPGDYTSASFSLLVDGSDIGMSRCYSIALVEAPMTVGGIDLAEGDLLITTTGADVQRLQLSSTGEDTVGTLSMFLDFSDIATFANTVGLDFISESTTLGNVTLSPGQILWSPGTTCTFNGGTPITVEQQDIMIIDVITAGNDTSATATLLFDGSDVGLDYDDEDIQGISLIQTTSPYYRAGITITPTSGLTTTEAGGQASFDVVLKTKPTDTVTITITSGDLTEGTVSTSLLTFDETNWNMAQTVTITGVDDDLFDGDVDYTILTGTASSLDANYNGLDVADVMVSNAGDEARSSDLWLNTADNVATSGTPGLDSWTSGQVLEFDGTNPQMEPGGTSGEFSLAFDINPFVGDGDGHIDALHYVTQSVTVGTHCPFELLSGDIVFSMAADGETVGGILAANEDILVFRPDTPDDYSSGTFSLLFDSSVLALEDTLSDIQALTLVERSVTVGGITLDEGDLLIVDSDATVKRLKISNTGTYSYGATAVFLDLTDLGVDPANTVTGLDLIGESTVIGDTTLTAGQVLIACASPATIGSGTPISVTQHDIVILDVSVAGAATSATATLLFDGSDVGLDTAAEAISAITIMPNDDNPPVEVNNTGSTVAEGGTDTITLAELRYMDEQPTTSVTYTVTSSPTNGQLELTTDPGVAVTSFTQDDINNNRVVYVHDGSETTTDGFTFSVDDGQGYSVTGQMFDLTISPVDDTPPVEVNNTGSTIAEGGTDTLASTELLFTDSEQPATSVTYTVTSSPANGQLELTTDPGVAVTSFTQDDINNNRVVYVHDGSETTTDGFTFNVDDGQGNSVTGQTFDLSISSVDDTPPVEVSNTGSTVAAGSTDRIIPGELLFTDSEQSATSVHYTVTSSPTNGQLELTTDPGVAVTSFTQDDIDNGRVVYVHDGSETTTDSFTFSVDDGQGNSVTGQTFNFTIEEPVEVHLWVQGYDDAIATGTPGLDSWTGGQVLEFGGSNLQFEPGGTLGEFSVVFDINPFVAEGHTRIDAIHYVSHEVTVGTDVSFTLLEGDILFTTEAARTIGGYVVQNEDVYVFRPDTPGDYTSGSFAMLIDGSDLGLTRCYSIALVETTMNVGGVDLVKGDFLLTGTGADVQRLQLTSVGANTVGTLSMFLDFSDVATFANTVALDIVNEAVTLGDITLSPGQILWSPGSTCTIGTGTQITVDEHDFVILDVITAGDNTSAIATLFFEGLDVGLDTGAEDMQGITLVSSNATYYTRPGISVTPTSGLTTTEAGGQATFDVVLDTKPTDTVTITITSSDLTEGTISTSLLTFDETNWNIAQTVTITGIDDDLFDGDVDYTILTGTASSLDANYNGLTVADVTVSNASDEARSNDLWLNTTDSVATSGAPGLDAWTRGEVLEFDGVNPLMEPGNTSGEFAVVFDINPFVTDGNGHIDAMHYVTRTVTVGSGISFVLQSGDIVFSMADSETVGGIAVADEDLLVFRPNTPGDYSSGTISLLLDSSDLTSGYALGDIESLTLVERSITVGGVTLDEGDFLIVDSDATVKRLKISNTGSYGVGATTTFLDLTDLGADPANTVTGLDLIGESTVIGDTTLTAGQILVSFASPCTIGSGTPISVTQHDIVILDVSVAGAATSATATLLFDGSDVGLDTAAEAISAITIMPNDDNPPTVVNNTGSTVAEGGIDTILNTELLFTDEQPATSVVYTITSTPINGQIELTTDLGVAVTSFTQDDIDNNRVVYVHDGSETTSDSFTFSISDGLGNLVAGQTFDILVDGNPPVEVNNTGSTVAEGGTDTLASTELRYTDEQPATSVTYTVTNSPTHGQLELTTNPGVAVTSFTQSDINNNRVVYVHDGTNTTTDGFTFSVDDGQGNSVTGQTFDLTISPVDDTSPVEVNNTGLIVVEAETGTITSSELLYTDSEQPATSVTYTITSAPTYGQLELTTDPGVAVTGFTQDDIDNNRVIYAHDGSKVELDSFTFSVDDGQGNSVTGQTFDLFISLNDPGTPEDETPPVEVNNTGSTIAEGGTDTLAPTELLFTDSEQPATAVTYTVTSSPTHGQLELTTDPGVAVMSFTQDDINNNRVVYIHDGTNTTTDGFTFSVDDGQGNSVTGQTFDLTISPVNDTPVAVGEFYSVNNNDMLIVSGGGLLANDSDVDLDALSVVLVGNVSNGVLVLQGNGAFTYTPSSLFSGTDNFSYRVSDGSALSDVVTVNISVAAVVSPLPPDEPSEPDQPEVEPPVSVEPVSVEEDEENDEDEESDVEVLKDPLISMRLVMLNWRDHLPDNPQPVQARSLEQEAPLLVLVQSDAGMMSREFVFQAVERVSRVVLLQANLSTDMHLSSSVEEALIPVETGSFVYETAPDFDLLWHQSDSEASIEEVTASEETMLIGSATVLATTVSVVYVFWVFRGGCLMASMLSSIATWRMIDPLPILENFEGQSEYARCEVEEQESLCSLAMQSVEYVPQTDSSSESTAIPAA